MHQRVVQRRGRHRRRSVRRQWTSQDTCAVVLMAAFAVLAVTVVGSQIGHLATP